jgi:hypothetical protein
MDWIRENGAFVESFLYGVYIGVVFVPLYNFISRRWGQK